MRQGVLHGVHGGDHRVAVDLHLEPARDDPKPDVLICLVEQHAGDKLLAVLHVHLRHRRLVRQVGHRLELQRVPQQVDVPHVVVEGLVRSDGACFNNLRVDHRLDAVRQ